jgi:translation initiation factor IF-2
VPIIVAVVNQDRQGQRATDVVMRDLANEGLQSKSGAATVAVPERLAHTGVGINELLEKVLLQSEMLELTANPRCPRGRRARGLLTRDAVPWPTCWVRNGTLKVGDLVVAGQAWGKVKAMTDDRGPSAARGRPATPIEILGLSEVPGAGESIYVVTDAKKAQEISDVAKRAESAAMPDPVAHGSRSDSPDDAERPGCGA